MVIADGVQMELSGWGRFPKGTTCVHRPERIADLVDIVRSRSSSVARGLGRSYGDASFNSAGKTLLIERLNRFLSFDESTGVLECEAGVTIAEVLDCFVPRGFFPPVVPGTKHVTLGGAVACDIHGKNHHSHGSISRYVLDFHLLTPRGERLICDREEKADLFWATIGGMGLTGVILQLRVKLQRIETSYLSVDYDRTADIDETLELMRDGDHRYVHSVAWVDGLARGSAFGRSVLMRANPAPTESGRELTLRRRSAPSVPKAFPGSLLNRASLKAFNAIFYRKHPRRARGVLEHYERFFFQLDAIANWNQLYGRNGFTQWQCALPFDGGRDAVAEILQTFAGSGPGPFLIVLKQFGPGEPHHLLSFPIHGYTLAIDVPCRARTAFEAMEQADDIVLERGGRIYLAKDARLAPRRASEMYRTLDRWREVKAKVDPNNTFTSDLAARLQLAP